MIDAAAGRASETSRAARGPRGALSFLDTDPKRRSLQLLAALTLLGLVLRLVALDAESAWMDEIYSMRMARAPLADLLSGAVRDRGNPAGYYVLLHAWLDLFGDSLLSARTLSALAGTLAIPLTACLALVSGRERSWRVALVAAALVALSPPLVYLAREARVFALATPLVLLHLLAVAWLVARERLWPWALYVISAAALLYLHYFSVFVLVSAGGYLLVARRGRLWPFAAAVGVVVLLFLPYLPTLSWQVGTGMERSVDSWWKHGLFMPAFVFVGRTLVWIEQGIAQVIAVLALALAGVWGPTLWTLRARVPWLLVAVGVGAIALAAAFSLVAPLLLGRYASMVFPVLMILVAVAFEYATKRLRIVVAATTLGLMSAALVGLYGGHHKDDWRALDAQLDARRAIYVVPYEAVHGVAFYRPELSVTPLDPRTVDATTLRARLRADHDDAWLVLYRYDPRVAVSTERALKELADIQVDIVIGDRRLALLHLRRR